MVIRYLGNKHRRNTSLKLESITDTIPYHSGTIHRNIQDIKSNIVFHGFDPNRVNQYDNIEIAIVDDVITTGAHFKACQELILEQYPHAAIYGIFLAKTVWIDDN